MACVCTDCGLTGESCLCSETSRCVSCEFFDYVDGCIMPPSLECNKDLS